MSNNSLLDSIQFIRNFSDDMIWEPFCNNTDLVIDFESKLNKVKESENWPKELNKEKGNVLEVLMKFVFERFVHIETLERTKITTDNEIDLEICFNPNIPLPFFVDKNSKFICECKNVHSKSVDVGMVSKLVELCSDRKAGLGIFVSVLGLSGRGWRRAQGKRRKLFLRNGMPVISFTLKEIETLKNNGVNFLTLIKQKYSALIDEIDDDSPVLKKSSPRDPDFKENLIESLNTFEKFNLICSSEKSIIIQRIIEKYGDFNDN